MINRIHVSFGGEIIRVVVSFAVLVSLVARAVGVETNAVLVHARELAASGRWVEATAEVQKQLPSLKQPAEQANAHEMLGDLFLRANTLRDMTNALDQYDQALALAPTTGGLYLKQARLLFLNPDWHNKAGTALQRCLEVGYTNVDVFYLLGAISKCKADEATSSQQARNYILTALGHYRRALCIDTNHVPTLGNIADILFNAQQYAQAAQVYEKLLKLESAQDRSPAVMSRLGHTQTRLGNFDQAAALLEQAQTAWAKTPTPNDPIRNANLQIERVRVLTFQMENSLAARKPADAIAPCRAIRAAVAELSKTFTSPQLKDWDQAAKQVLESQESPPK